MRARDSVYHLSCFTCSTCNKTLTTGDHFGMKDSPVYCRTHFETLSGKESIRRSWSYTELAAKSGGLALPYSTAPHRAEGAAPETGRAQR